MRNDEFGDKKAHLMETKLFKQLNINKHFIILLWYLSSADMLVVPW